MSDWYVFISQLSAALQGPIGNLSGDTGIPFLSAFLLGVVGSVAPCQLSANLATLSYVSRQGQRPRLAAFTVGAYLAGKIIVYSVIGLAVLLLGRTMVSTASVPFFAVARKAMGPALLLSGLLMAGVIRLPFSFGEGLSQRLARRGRNGGASGAFLLGMGFSLAFCPTLFVLFFVLLMPMSMATAGGFVFPGFFAVGTALPLIILGPLISLGTLGGKGLAGRARKVDKVLRIVMGVVFILAGINEIINYWLA
ncbi:MAG: sulfite exporter TauE/SafE family protein [Dehalococcoidia bacterium]|nr:sulfite exporter TauE/SafE family protein [Dehalococcoidia bacterium]